MAQKKADKTPEVLAKASARHAEMAKRYAQHVLKERPTLQLRGLGGKKKASRTAGSAAQADRVNLEL